MLRSSPLLCLVHLSCFETSLRVTSTNEQGGQASQGSPVEHSSRDMPNQSDNTDLQVGWHTHPAYQQPLRQSSPSRDLSSGCSGPGFHLLLTPHQPPRQGQPLWDFLYVLGSLEVIFVIRINPKQHSEHWPGSGCYSYCPGPAPGTLSILLGPFQISYELWLWFWVL